MKERQEVELGNAVIGEKDLTKEPTRIITRIKLFQIQKLKGRANKHKAYCVMERS